MLGGSWVVISRVLSRVAILITHIRGLITPSTRLLDSKASPGVGPWEATLPPELKGLGFRALGLGFRVNYQGRVLQEVESCVRFRASLGFGRQSLSF